MNRMDGENSEVLQRLRSAYSDLPDTPVSAERIQSSVRRRRRRRRTALAGSLAAAAVVGTWALWPQAEPEMRAEVIEAPSALELYSSSSAEDWVTKADVVVYGEVLSEASGTESSGAAGSGESTIARKVVFRIQDTLWTSDVGPDFDRREIVIGAFGWAEQADGTMLPIALPGTPRLEVGNYYLIALKYEGTCNPWMSDDWAPLGSEAVWPADDGVIGFGESSGRRVEGDRDQAEEGSLEEGMIGRSPAEVGPILDTEATKLPQRSTEQTC